VEAEDAGMKLPIRGRRRLIAAAACAVVAPAARADAYPSRPLRLIVPYPAGGATDFIGRILAAELASRLSQQVVVENRPGATTIVAAEVLVRAPADGHTLMLADTATLATNPALYRRLPYDPAKDFSAVARVARIPLLLAVPADSPLRDVAALVAAARVRTLNFGSPGLGSPHHLTTELFRRQTGTQLQHVPYKGAAPVMQDLVGGRLEMAFLDLPTVRGALAGHRLRLLGVATLRRLEALPEVATLDEQGVRGVDAFAWQGLVGPAGMAMDRVSILYRHLDSAIGGTALKQRFVDGGVEPFGAAPGQFTGFIAAETKRWAQVIGEAGIRLE
jgi:tripartite-type tricarboxylate transporter receptor subunit TctC